MLPPHTLLMYDSCPEPGSHEKHNYCSQPPSGTQTEQETQRGAFRGSWGRPAAGFREVWTSHTENMLLVSLVLSCRLSQWGSSRLCSRDTTCPKKTCRQNGLCRVVQNPRSGSGLLPKLLAARPGLPRAKITAVHTDIFTRLDLKTI